MWRFECHRRKHCYFRDSAEIKGKQVLDPALGDKQPQDMSTQQGRAAAGRGQRWLTCPYPGRNSHTVWLFWDGPAACVSGTPCTHACKEVNVNTVCFSADRNLFEPIFRCMFVYVCDILVIILLFLLSPVLVELMDFHSGVALLKQVKRLHVTRKHRQSYHMQRE